MKSLLNPLIMFYGHCGSRCTTYCTSRLLMHHEHLQSQYIMHADQGHAQLDRPHDDPPHYAAAAVQ
jgi:hypothetical protein